MRYRRGLILVAVLAIGALGSSAVTMGHTHTFPSQVTIGLDASHGQILDVSGKVTSPNAHCVAGRKVNLIFVDRHTGIRSSRGHTTANAHGDWRLSGVHGNQGEFDAVIGKFTFKQSRHHHHSCKAAHDSLDFP